MSIHPSTHIGKVHLTVSNLERSLAFYQDRLGFQVASREDGTAVLAAGDRDLLVLVENPDARPVRHTTGLYHFAVLVPSRIELAQSLRHIAETQTPVTGFADHLVSEAIYLPDPDFSGIEIYRDRPREDWPRLGDQIQMATDPLDLDSILNELAGQDGGWSGLADGTTIGHMHLHVRDIPEAEAFYRDILGFDLIMELGGSAAFVSAGGYHHHIGLNIWNGRGAPPPPPDATGLRHFEVVLADSAALEDVCDRLDAAGIAIEPHPDGLLIRDPSQNALVLTVQPQA